MASIDFTCQKCEGSFEIGVAELADGSEPLECPHCGAKPTKALAEDFVNALGDLVAQATALSKKFTVSISIDTEEADVADDDEVEEEEDDDLDEDDDDDDDDDDEEPADDDD